MVFSNLCENLSANWKKVVYKFYTTSTKKDKTSKAGLFLFYLKMEIPMSESDFQKILEDVQEISELLDFNVIFIGGVATYLYSEKHKFFPEFSHYADFYMNML